MTPVSSGSCARKIRIASALTNPVMTDRETKRMRWPSFARPAPIWMRPANTVAAKQVLKAVVLHQRDHHHGRGRGGRRDHGRTPAGDRNYDRDRERGVQPDLRVHACDDREGDGFRDQRQRNDEPGENVGADVSDPLVAIRVECVHAHPDKRPSLRPYGRGMRQLGDG